MLMYVFYVSGIQTKPGVGIPVQRFSWKDSDALDECLNVTLFVCFPGDLAEIFLNIVSCSSVFKRYSIINDKENR